MNLVSGQSISGNINDVASGNIGALPGNVTAGNLLVITLQKLISVAGGDNPVAGDFSLAGGSATLGTVQVDKAEANNYDAGDSYIIASVISVPVTGTGTCTIGIVTGLGQYCFATVEELTGADVSAGRVAQVNGASSSVGAPTNSPQSGNATLSAGGMFYGALCFTGASATVTPDGAYTQVYENEANSNNMGSVIREIVGSGATDSADWTLSATRDWAAAVVAYKDAAGGAATLSAPTPSGTIGTQTTATVGATTDQTSGNFYAVVDSAANLSGVTAAQIKAGQKASGAAALGAGNSAVSNSSPSAGITGLTLGTLYSYSAVQNNVNGDSNIVSGTFTTAAQQLMLGRRKQQFVTQEVIQS